jgi:hypothetical protein
LTDLQAGVAQSVYSSEPSAVVVLFVAALLELLALRWSWSTASLKQSPSGQALDQSLEGSPLELYNGGFAGTNERLAYRCPVCIAELVLRKAVAVLSLRHTIRVQNMVRVHCCKLESAEFDESVSLHSCVQHVRARLHRVNMLSKRKCSRASHCSKPSKAAYNPAGCQRSRPQHSRQRVRRNPSRTLMAQSAELP